jgi:hypothetical protein
MPGDLQMMWRARDPKGYHVEYGYSCMGYEIAGALSVKMAAPDREVYAPVLPLGAGGTSRYPRSPGWRAAGRPARPTKPTRRTSAR